MYYTILYYITLYILYIILYVYADEKSSSKSRRIPSNPLALVFMLGPLAFTANLFVCASVDLIGRAEEAVKKYAKDIQELPKIRTSKKLAM